MSSTPDSPAVAGERETAILYTNHRGETAVRRIEIATFDEMPRVWFGKTKWHPEGGLLFEAWDFDKKALRAFAFSGIKAWGQEAVDAALAQPAAPGGGGGDRPSDDALHAADGWLERQDRLANTLSDRLCAQAARQAVHAMITTRPAQAEAGAAGTALSAVTRRADYHEERAQYWCGEAQRLAWLVRRLGGDPIAPKPEPPAAGRSEGGSFQPKIETCPKCGAQGVAFICDQRGCPVNGGAAYPWTEYPAAPVTRSPDAGGLEDLRRLSEVLDGIDPHAEAEKYEFRDPDYTPTDDERVMLEDFAAGLLSKVADAILSASPPVAGPGLDREAVARAAARRVIFGITDGPDVPWDADQSVMVRAGRVESEMLALLAATPPAATPAALMAASLEAPRDAAPAAPRAPIYFSFDDEPGAGREGPTIDRHEALARELRTGVARLTAVAAEAGLPTERICQALAESLATEEHMAAFERKNARSY